MNPAQIERLGALLGGLDEWSEIMQAQRGRFEALKGRHEDGTAPRAVSAFNLFQTPAHIAARMVEIAKAEMPNAARILEPSAGLGRIYHAIAAGYPAARVVMVEESDECRRELSRTLEGREGDRVFAGDFLEIDPADIGGTFDLVIMNPPFKQGRDIKHILHARAMLRPGGLLVSLCYAGARQSGFLKPLADTWEMLPDGTFSEEGTKADVALLTIKNTPKGN